MIYQTFQDLRLSALGLGCMRLPVIDGDDSRIDEKEAEKLIDLAMKKGINYYDTAWGYHGGNSETVLGDQLQKYPRESYFLADKFPGYDLSNMDKIEEIFEQQLKKCKTDYFDFYLFHNVCEMNIDAYLNPDYRILSYLLKQKKNGRIRHLGFSVHGSFSVMERFLQAYGDHMEFCQIQLNYLDWHFQDAKRKVEELNRLQIPIWVMEPLRGGRLANLTQAEEHLLKTLRPEETVPGWAFRYLQSIPGVSVILSGMSDIKQLEENLLTFETKRPLNEREMAALTEMAENMVSQSALACTACHYCVSHCPQGLDIPALLAFYNEHRFTGGGFIAPMALSALPPDKQPGACIGCKSCEAVCPQQLNISDALADFTKMLS